MISSSRYSVKTHDSTQAGFSLIELMVVIVILSIFAGMMTLSVSSSETRKNLAYYEHLLDSLRYMRLLSAEQMQPIGIRLIADKKGKLNTEVVKLDNAYQPYEKIGDSLNNSQDTAKNNMELSAMSVDGKQKTPKWIVNDQVSLPELPDGINIQIASIDTLNATNVANQQLQPWFSTGEVPQLMWFGTGQATGVKIDVRYKDRLVADSIYLMPDGSLVVGLDANGI